MENQGDQRNELLKDKKALNRINHRLRLQRNTFDGLLTKSYLLYVLDSYRRVSSLLQNSSRILSKTVYERRVFSTKSWNGMDSSWRIRICPRSNH